MRLFGLRSSVFGLWPLAFGLWSLVLDFDFRFLILELLGASFNQRSKDQRPKAECPYKKSGHLAASSNRFVRGSLDNQHSLFLVKFLEHNFNNLALLCRYELTDVVRLDRQLSMLFTAVNEHR